jgi:AhpC/TSA family
MFAVNFKEQFMVLRKFSFGLFIFISLNAFLFLSFKDSAAQTGKVPPFRMMQTGGKVFKAENLPMGKPIIIVYFSPDCDHCTKFLTEFFKRSGEFKKASVALITYLPVEEVSRFEKNFNLDKYTNVYVGTEGNSFFVRNYYKIVEMPFVALFNRNGDLIKLYPKEGFLNDLSAKLKNLN